MTLLCHPNRPPAIGAIGAEDFTRGVGIGPVIGSTAMKNDTDPFATICHGLHYIRIPVKLVYFNGVNGPPIKVPISAKWDESWAVLGQNCANAEFRRFQPNLNTIKVDQLNQFKASFTTLSATYPNFSSNTANGAEAPNRVIP